MKRYLHSLRLALFLDAKSFYLGWKEHLPDCEFDVSLLIKWLTNWIGGGSSVGIHCYVQQQSDSSCTPLDAELEQFISLLKMHSGAFIYQLPPRDDAVTCDECGGFYYLLENKRMEIMIASNVIHLAAKNVYDAAVLLSHEKSYVPVLETLKFMGKQAYVTHWADETVHKQVKSAAFGRINLSKMSTVPCRYYFIKKTPGNLMQHSPPIAMTHFTGDHELDAFLSELTRATQKFAAGNGYVGLGYFLNYWNSEYLGETASARRTILDRLLVENWVETYDVGGGKLALQLSDRARERFREIAAQQ
ncbi:MAG: NYN domain-containing protein [Myxococcota bacterium]